MQVQDGADVLLALAVGQVLLVVGLAQEGQSHTVTAQRRLDDVGDVVLVGLAVEILEALAGGLLMAAQVVVGAGEMCIRDRPTAVPAMMTSPEWRVPFCTRMVAMGPWPLSLSLIHI